MWGVSYGAAEGLFSQPGFGNSFPWDMPGNFATSPQGPQIRRGHRGGRRKGAGAGTTSMEVDADDDSTAAPAVEPSPDVFAMSVEELLAHVNQGLAAAGCTQHAGDTSMVVGLDGSPTFCPISSAAPRLDLEAQEVVAGTVGDNVGTASKSPNLGGSVATEVGGPPVLPASTLDAPLIGDTGIPILDLSTLPPLNLRTQQHRDSAGMTTVLDLTPQLFRLSGDVLGSPGTSKGTAAAKGTGGPGSPPTAIMLERRAAMHASKASCLGGASGSSKSPSLAGLQLPVAEDGSAPPCTTDAQGLTDLSSPAAAGDAGAGMATLPFLPPLMLSTPTLLPPLWAVGTPEVGNSDERLGKPKGKRGCQDGITFPSLLNGQMASPGSWPWDSLGPAAAAAAGGGGLPPFYIPAAPIYPPEATDAELEDAGSDAGYDIVMLLRHVPGKALRRLVVHWLSEVVAQRHLKEQHNSKGAAAAGGEAAGPADQVLSVARRYGR
jgi:hypothetical protein